MTRQKITLAIALSLFLLGAVSLASLFYSLWQGVDYEPLAVVGACICFVGSPVAERALRYSR